MSKLILRLLVIVLIHTTPLLALQLPNDPEVIERDILRLMSERLTAFQAARLYWIDQACGLSNEQKERLHRVNSKLIDDANRQLQVAFKEKDGSQYPFSYTLTTVIFPSSTFGAKSLDNEAFEKDLDGILTSDQQARYQQNLQKRQSSLHHGFVCGIVDLIDEELYLTVVQREMVKEKFHQGTRRENALYSLRRDGVRSPYRKPDASFQVPISCLTNLQRHRWDDLNAKKDGYQFSYSFKGDTLQACIEDAERSEEENEKAFVNAMLVKLDYYRDFLDLTFNDMQRLEMALVGIAQRNSVCLRNLRYCSNAYSSGLSEKLSYPPLNIVDPITIEWDPFWKSLSERFGFSVAIEARRKERQHMVAEFVLAVLEEELWLTSEQREQLRQLVEQTVGMIELPDRNYFMFRDEMLMARVLAKMPAEEVSKILSNDQHLVWAKITNLFRVFDDAVIWNIPVLNGQTLW